MSIEANKAIVQQFLAKFGSGDADGLIDSLTEYVYIFLNNHYYLKIL